MSNSSLRRQSQISLFVFRFRALIQPASPHPQRRPDLVKGKPLGILQFWIIAQINLFSFGHRLSNCADHQVCGIWPWLGGVDDHATEMDTSFFPNLSTSGFFDRLCGFAEAGEGGIPVFGETLAAAE